MGLEIRKADLAKLNAEGIPEDFAALKEYWNYGVKTQEGMFRFIPRRKEISNEEIKQLFVPAIDEGRSINLVAESNGKIIGAITVIYDSKATAYEYNVQRKPGAIGESVDPRIGDYSLVLFALYQGIILELKQRNLAAHAVFPVEDVKSIEVLRSLGLNEREKEHEPYKAIGLSGRGIEFEIC